MFNKARALRLGALAMMGATLAISAACSSGGVSDADYKKVQQQLQDAQSQNQQLQAQAGAAKASPSAGAGGAGLISSVKVTPNTPAPTPTPGGPTPTPAPPKATPGPEYYQSQPYAVYVETIATTTASKYNVASSIACTPSGVFARGQRIVFRIQITDTSTGKLLTDKDGAQVKVVAPNGDESLASFSQRGGGKVPDAPFMWAGTWDIPTDFALGAVDYKIVITPKSGQAFTWKPPALISAALGEDTRPKVVQ
jgi:hypothetical protein